MHACACDVSPMDAGACIAGSWLCRLKLDRIVSIDLRRQSVYRPKLAERR